MKTEIGLDAPQRQVNSTLLWLYAQLWQLLFFGLVGAAVNTHAANNATLVSQTIADGAVMAPGQTFTQSWILRNTGTTTWSPGSPDGFSYSFNRISGDSIGGADGVLLSDFGPPGGRVTLSVDFPAPAAPGTYTGYWRMQSEAGNFGMFIGSSKDLHKVAKRIREAALDLGVKRIVVGECGHAWRVAYSFWNTLIGPFDFLDQRYPIPQHICEFTYDLIQRNALKFDKSANDDKIVTFHDSCNVARASRMGNMPGGQFIIPRAVVRASVNKFFDMAPETIYESTYCCGGGGGLLTDELLDLRIKGTAPRMQAFKDVVEQHGVTHIAAICAICKAQFTKVLPYYKFPMDTIQSVHGLVSKAIRLGAVNE